MLSRALPVRVMKPGDSGISKHIFAEVGPEHFGNVDAAIGSLVILEDHDQCPRERDGRAVQRMDKPCSLLTAVPVADVQTSGLVIGAVGGTGHLAVLAGRAATGHPGFEVELAVGGPAEITGADIE